MDSFMTVQDLLKKYNYHFIHKIFLMQSKHKSIKEHNHRHHSLPKKKIKKMKTIKNKNLINWWINLSIWAIKDKWQCYIIN